MPSSSTTVQNNKPYEAAQPGIDAGLAAAQGLFDRGGFNIRPYSGDMVAGYDPLRQRAAYATPGAVNTAMGRTADAVGGMSGVGNAWSGSAWQGADVPSDVLGFAPGLDQVRENVIADIMPAINSSFAADGRTGGGLHQQNLSKGLAAGVGGVYYDAYNRAQDRALNAFNAGQDRSLAAYEGAQGRNAAGYNAAQGRAIQSAGLIPALNAADFGALDYMRGVGADRQGYQQDVINADVLRDQQGQASEMQALQDYLALVSGAGSMFGVQSSTARQNPGLLGYLGAGAKIGGMFL